MEGIFYLLFLHSLLAIIIKMMISDNDDIKEREGKKKSDVTCSLESHELK